MIMQLYSCKKTNQLVIAYYNTGYFQFFFRVFYSERYCIHLRAELKPDKISNVVKYAFSLFYGWPARWKKNPSKHSFK